MPLYRYEAQDQFGKKASGSLEAANPAGLRTILLAGGFRLTSVQVIAPEDSPTVPIPNVNLYAQTSSTTTPPPDPSTPAIIAPLHGTRNLSTRAHALLFREFGAAFRSGMTAFQACDMIGGRYRSGAIARMLGWTRERVREGSGLADAIASSPITLEPPTIGIIRAGEHGGFLPDVMDELADTYERVVELQNKVSPIKMFYGWMVLPALLLAWPLPAMLTGSSNAAMANADQSATLSAGFQAYGIGVLHTSVPAGVALVLLFLLWKAIQRRKTMQSQIDAAALRVPLWGTLQKSICMARFTRLMGRLYRGGIPVRDSWRLSSEAIPNKSMMTRLLLQEPAIAAGTPLSQVLSATGLFRNDEISLLATGEHTGELDEMLFRLSRYYDETASRSIQMIPRTVNTLALIACAPFIIIVIAHFFQGYMSTLLKWSQP